MKVRKKTLDVLHSDDLEQFLINMEIYENFKNEKILCNYCNVPINFDNVCALTFRKESIIFICDKESCHKTFLRLQKGEE